MTARNGGTFLCELYQLYLHFFIAEHVDPDSGTEGKVQRKSVFLSVLLSWAKNRRSQTDIGGARS
jgi:hypothetical protein